MPPAYIRHGRIFFVPIVPQRLSFAVLVWRAFRELEQIRALDPAVDAIGVALPRSLLAAVDAALLQLDAGQGSGRLSLLYTSTGPGSHREVFPVTPSDGVVEAIRCARQRGLTVECIDRELEPGHLASGTCVSDPLWPDDELVLRNGPQWYLERLQPLLAHPPQRREPIDTWREAFMTERLRQLSAERERVLVVCHATHVGPIRAQLRRPARVQAASAPDSGSRLRIERAHPSVALQLHYLDDMPRLVELFNRSRRDGAAAHFSKLAGIVQIALTAGAACQRDFSIRHYEAFAAMLRRTALSMGRLAPRLDEVVALAQACFNDETFAERLRRELLGYYDAVHGDDVGEQKAGPSDAEAGVEDERRVVTRSCNPAGKWYELLPAPVLEGASNGGESLVWPPFKTFLTAMRRKALQLATQPLAQKRTFRFQGSLHHGIDVRRTLRSHAAGEPTVYVTHRKRSQRDVRTGDDLEPVVWLFEAHWRRVRPWGPTSIVITRNEDRKTGWTSTWICAEEHDDLARLDLEGRIIRITHHTILGAVSFCSPRLTLEELHGEYGARLEQRVPRFRTVDSRLAPLNARLVPGANWHDILIEGALRFASSAITLVCPSALVVSDACRASARRSGRRIQRVPLSHFTLEQRRKLRSKIGLDGLPDIGTVDRNDERVVRYLVEQFRHLIKSRW